jgi:UDP-galactopyranose mutase
MPVARYLRKIIKGYTEKEWARPCSELPASLIKACPCADYYNTILTTRTGHPPRNGYTAMVERCCGMSALGTEYLKERAALARWRAHGVHGPIDACLITASARWSTAALA